MKKSAGIKCIDSETAVSRWAETERYTNERHFIGPSCYAQVQK